MVSELLQGWDVNQGASRDSEQVKELIPGIGRGCGVSQW